jgi:4'-phosphopantetheinyl transferase
MLQRHINSTTWTRKPDLQPADVWVVYAGLDESDLENGWTVLANDEKARADRFVCDLHRDRFIAARSFLRLTLSEITRLAPEQLEFAYEANGRPYLAGSNPQPTLSLSHSDDLVVVAVSWTGPLGIDIECVRPLDDCDAIAEQIMHPRELEAFHRLPDSARLGAFYRLWTRKEALLKAWGFGFSAEPRKFDVRFDALLDECMCEVDDADCVVRGIQAPPGFAAALCSRATARLIVDRSCARLPT